MVRLNSLAPERALLILFFFSLREEKCTISASQCSKATNGSQTHKHIYTSNNPSTKKFT